LAGNAPSLLAGNTPSLLAGNTPSLLAGNAPSFIRTVLANSSVWCAVCCVCSPAIQHAARLAKADLDAAPPLLFSVLKLCTEFSVTFVYMQHAVTILAMANLLNF
jgi:hypothetical protein